jgi:cupin fold WbuC family metalloprotein
VSLHPITRKALQELARQAGLSPRRRKNLNLHTALSDPIQRLFNAVEPDSYVRPHRHERNDVWELLVAIRGRFAALSFDAGGQVLNRTEFGADGDNLGVELPPGTWHTVVALAPGSVLFEVKPGPYEPLNDKDFATWAPAEGDPAAAAFVDWYRRAMPGERPPGR